MSTPAMTVQLHGLDDVIDRLKALPPEVASKRGGPVRVALRKGAAVIHRQELANLAAATARATGDKARYESTGFLAKNVVITRGKAPTGGQKGERYLVRVRRKTYPGRPEVSTLKTGQLLEYGSSQQPAEPWIRPAVASRAGEAIETIRSELLAGIDRIVRRLAKQAKGRG